MSLQLHLLSSDGLHPSGINLAMITRHSRRSGGGGKKKSSKQTQIKAASRKKQILLSLSFAWKLLATLDDNTV